MNDLILKAREERYEHIQKLSKTYKNLITLKANTPGLDKNRYSSFFLVKQLNKIIENRFQINYITLIKGFDGPYYVYALSNNSLKNIKLELIDIENNHPLGRYIDIDLYVNSLMISRDDFNIPLRKCMICKNIAIDCMRNNRHNFEEVLDHIDYKILNYLKANLKDFIKESMLNELNLEHKFGLVTPTSSGSHTDMNFKVMFESIEVLMPYFLEIFELGYLSVGQYNLFDKANVIGLKAEQEMLLKSNGVNTYKGFIYLLGFVLLALADIIKKNKPFSDLFDIVKGLSSHVLSDFKLKISSAGIDAFNKHKMTGIRGEVYNGLPTIVNAFDHFNEIDISNPKHFHAILLYFIIHSEDTVLLKRSKSLESYNHIKDLASKIDPYNMKEIIEFSEYCISHHLSFGGSADLFIVFQFINYMMSFTQ